MSRAESKLGAVAASARRVRIVAMHTLLEALRFALCICSARSERDWGSWRSV